jgi:hypothetical protein
LRLTSAISRSLKWAEIAPQVEPKQKNNRFARSSLMAVNYNAMGIAVVTSPLHSLTKGLPTPMSVIAWFSSTRELIELWACGCRWS